MDAQDAQDALNVLNVLNVLKASNALGSGSLGLAETWVGWVRSGL